jgi:hypothetical protein
MLSGQSPQTIIIVIPALPDKNDQSNAWLKFHKTPETAPGEEAKPYDNDVDLITMLQH